MPLIRLSERQWARYHRGLAGEVTRRLAARRESLILEHLPMCERIARKVRHSFAPHLDIRDLVQAARLGLVQAADRYRSEDGPFCRFAYLRVRGAVIDSQKRRTYREESHYSIDQWFERASEGRMDAAAINFARARIARYLSDRGPAPDERAQASEKTTRLRAAIERFLSDEERAVIERALAGELAAGIAARFGHSPNWARVRLHKARQKLAARLQEAA